MLASLALIALLVPAAAPAAKGGVIEGSVPRAGMNVVLFAATPGASAPATLGSTRSGRGGAFSLRYRASGDGAVKYLVVTRPGGGAEAGFPVPGSTYRLAAALGAGAVPRRAAVNERTTVAIGFAMAQFLSGNKAVGGNPGLRNAAAMTRNLVGLRKGGLSPVLKRYPNGNATSTLRSFDSLANLLAICRAQDRRCATLLKLTGAPGGRRASDTLAAIVNVARYPWRNVRALYRLSLATGGRYAPALGPGEKPDAWTIALRFEGGTPRSLDGPGNFAIDKEGFLWVGNNYEYSRDLSQPVGPGKTVMRFTPTGRYASGSPIEAGGTSGAGFGIGIDPEDHVWVGNFGFEGIGFEGIPAPHNSVSEYGPNGEPISPGLEPHEEKLANGEIRRFYTGGWENGDLFWPQGTVSDVNGNIWIANCGNNSVTKYPGGEPSLAVNYPESTFTKVENGGLFELKRPFGVATNDAGEVFVTGNESHSVAVLDQEGEVVSRVKGGGLHRSLGIASDSRGNVWVGNSTWVVAPCAGKIRPEKGGPSAGGSVTLIKANGELAAKNPYRNGGIVNAWGIAIDGDDTVWVANFSGRRLAQLCGVRTKACPPGKRRVGAPISPAGTGYGFDGLERITAVQVDPSGNVWAANNWKVKAIQRNPGGYQIVAYLGVAAPIETPLIGQPEAP